MGEVGWCELGGGPVILLALSYHHVLRRREKRKSIEGMRDGREASSGGSAECGTYQSKG